MIETEDDVEFSISRLVKAPQHEVWRAWTELDRLAHWWGPKGFSWLDGILSLRPGGRFHYGMRSPDGAEMWGLWLFREIEAPSRLVFINSFANREGQIVRAPFSPDWPLEVENHLTLTAQGAATRLSLRGAPVNASPAERALFKSMHPSMTQGFGGTFEQLECYLAQGGGTQESA